MDWQKVYFMLFNSITDALAELTRAEMLRAVVILRQAQRRGEAMYLAGEPDPMLFGGGPPGSYPR